MQRSSSFFWQADDASSQGDSESLGLDFDDTATGLEYETPLSETSFLIPPRIVNYETPQSRTIIKKPPILTGRQVAVVQSSIRFQVVVWYVGEVDVRCGTVPMRFRVTLFWNEEKEKNRANNKVSNGNGSKPFTWTMEGRQKASLKEMAISTIRQIDVPPLSILNAVSYEEIGQPEVSVVSERRKQMRWSCMYSAVLMQDNMRVDNFPHDQHDLVLKVGILAHRNPGKTWDRDKWVLQLATEKDSHGSTRVPYGLLVDQVSIPGFHYKKDSLSFRFIPTRFGSVNQRADTCLEVKLTVFRDSGHYDKNIMPLMILLNIVAITCLPRHFSPNTGSTELMLSIAFVEIGFRLFIDGRLPSVGYQIKMQQILNRCFWLLMLLAIESNMVYILVTFFKWKREPTIWIDVFAGALALAYTIYMFIWYYKDVGIGPYEN
mmetsp:Transcript_26857/g.41125  ORF Transcript_26857/g.41125 Transcript_26857/m.41125 type:complete len:433 (-) Transcript_26857:1201-2499(-)